MRFVVGPALVGLLLLSGCQRPAAEAPAAPAAPAVPGAGAGAGIPGAGGKAMAGPVPAPAKGPEIPVQSGLGKELAEKADLPMYPGTVRSAAGETQDGDGGTRFEIRQYTPDPVDKVAEWYMGQLDLDRAVREGAVQLMGRSPGGSFVIITVTRPQGKDETEVVARAIRYAEGKAP